jgi:hypothetical protein
MTVERLVGIIRALDTGAPCRDAGITVTLEDIPERVVKGRGWTFCARWLVPSMQSDAGALPQPLQVTSSLRAMRTMPKR